MKFHFYTSPLGEICRGCSQIVNHNPNPSPNPNVNPNLGLIHLRVKRTRVRVIFSKLGSNAWANSLSFLPIYEPKSHLTAKYNEFFNKFDCS